MDLITGEESNSSSSSSNHNNNNDTQQQLEGKTSETTATAAAVASVDDGGDVVDDDHVLFSEVETAVEVDGGRTSKDPTPFSTDADNTGTTAAKKTAAHNSSSTVSIYGRPLPVSDSGGSFPNAGSVLGPYFCLGQLGKGTFSSIHKCINMQFYHNDDDDDDTNSNCDHPPWAAAMTPSQQQQLEAKPSGTTRILKNSLPAN